MSQLTVSKGFFSRYKTISSAILAANPGDEIYVEPGTYVENINIDKDIQIIGKGHNESITIVGHVRLTGLNIKNALLTGVTINNNVEKYAVEISRGALTIEDCTILSTKGRASIIIQGFESKPIIKNCQIRNSVSTGILITKGANPIIQNCEIYNGKETGITVTEKGQGTIERCIIYGHKSSAILIDTGANPHIKNCKLFNNQGNGLFVRDEGYGTLESCEVFGNVYANICTVTEGNPHIIDSKIYDGKENGLWIKEEGKGTLENCEIFGNKLANIEIATKGDLRIKDCKIYKSEEFGVSIKEEGKGTIENCEIFENNYSNVYITSGGNPYIKDCQLYKSEKNGIWVNEHGRGTLENCEIFENAYANIDITTEGNPYIKRCKIYRSEQNGIWVHEKGEGTLEHCQVYENKDEDIEVSKDSHLEIIGPTERKEKPIVDNKKVETQPKVDSQEETIELSDILAELDSLIGMENVKAEIRKTIEFIQFNQELSKFGIEGTINSMPIAPHTVLYGNPGTGKTTLALLLGKLYKAMGLLSSGHVVQVNREKLVGEYIGHTAPKTKKKIDEALGGILFIDEAYSLTNKGSENDFGPEALEILLEEMENRKGEFAVVVAGYEKEMNQFLTANPGLKSRFTQYFLLQDYTPDEMVEIAKKMVGEKKRLLSNDAVNLLHKEFTDLWRKRDRYFSNARTVRNYIDSILQAQAQRCMKIPKEKWTKELLLTLTKEDVLHSIPKKESKQFDVPINENLLQQALEKLYSMVGLNEVKSEIEKLVTLVRYYKEEGKELSELSPHTMLIGSPGTGKTVVARIIAKIYEALGILERGDLIEVNRDMLVSGHPGMSEQLIANFIDKAMGGTLFIDEAYQLTQYGPDDPGHKVIEVLLKKMEDERDNFIVIVAGYRDKMEQFLDSNDGLRRRFVRRIEFEDYSPENLMKISELMINERGYHIDDFARRKLFEYYQVAYAERDKTFGNAGLARNIVNESIKNLDFRVAQIPKEQRTEKMITMILQEDLSI